MTTPQQKTKQLIDRYLSGKATPEEINLLERAYHQAAARMDQPMDETPVEIDRIGFETWVTLMNRIEGTPVRTINLWPRIAAAASIIAVLGAGAYLFSIKPKPSVKTDDVSPFTAMTILKTGGKTIVLDKTKNGRIGASITKSTGETLTYTESAIIAIYDTIQVPAGGRPYTVKLSDGSKITLNAATTLRYPESFSKTNREQVELISGEIYAEIVHNQQAPLQIKAPGQLIEDIGTEFNISAYADDADKRTTLVEGAIKVNQRLLKPGQQTVLANNEITITKADLDQVTAWKDGDFNFRGQHIDVIMRQLARWYNIEVRYEGKMTDEVFYGTISRKKNISQVLHTLERTQKIHFKVEGRRVTVLNKK